MRSKKPKDEEKNVDFPEGKCQTFLTSLCLYAYLALVLVWTQFCQILSRNCEFQCPWSSDLLICRSLIIAKYSQNWEDKFLIGQKKSTVTNKTSSFLVLKKNQNKYYNIRYSIFSFKLWKINKSLDEILKSVQNSKLPFNISPGSKVIFTNLFEFEF